MVFGRSKGKKHEERGNSQEQLILLRHTGFGRFFHWAGSLLLSMAIITGFWMGSPQLFGFGIPMGWLRYLHLVVNTFLSGLVLARVYFALVTGDVRHFLPRSGDVRRFIQLMKYYLFIIKEKPYEPTKYNVGQRWIYSSWLFAWLFQAITGMILANPEKYMTLGKVVYDLQSIRFLRYLIAVYFTVTIFVHIYLVLTTSPANFQAMFTGYIRVKDGESE